MKLRRGYTNVVGKNEDEFVAILSLVVRAFQPKAWQPPKNRNQEGLNP